MSNWDVQCGNAQYARDLLRELEKEFSVIGLPGWMKQVQESLPSDVDVVVINWHPTRVHIERDSVRWLHSLGKKVILIIQESTPEDILLKPGDILMEADAIVAHEKMSFVEEMQPNLHVIWHGIPEVKDLPAPYPDKWIGVAGFPFPWKRFDVVAGVAKRCNARCRMVAPRSDQMDTDVYLNGIQGHLGPLADIHRGWREVDDVVRMLAECTVNIFWFGSLQREDQYGQSGSVRLGLAAKRPTIISTQKKLKTLFPYEDELYICPREEDVFKAVEEIFAAPDKAKVPKRVLEDMGWSVVGKKYCDLLKEL